QCNSRNCFQETALTIAAIHGLEHITHMLLENGVDDNAQSVQGNSALHWSVLSNHESIVDILLKHGGDINLKNKDRLSALNLACTEDHKSIVILLLRNSADVNLKCKRGLTPLPSRCHDPQKNQTKSLLFKHGADVKLKDNNGNPVIHELIMIELQCFGETLLNVLLDSSADINATNDQGHTQLHYAVYRGKEEDVRVLLK
ncbi:ankyrin repeat-containing domain protein, partial [Pyronema domesticum]